MKQFLFPHHEVQVAYPQRNSQLQMGGAWTHVIEPTTPPAKTFILSFRAMRYFLDSDGVPSAEISPERNLLTLEQFYAEHETHKTFTYTHYVHGLVTVLFAKPFTTPKLIPQGNGVSRGFTVELIEQPT